MSIKPHSAVSFDRLASVFAVALSLTALFVSVLEVFTTRAQQRAAVWPHLEISESYSEEGFQLRLTNKGVGPALTSDLRLSFLGQSVADLDALILKTLGPDDAFSYERYTRSIPSNSVIAAGEKIVLFSVEWDDQTRRLISAWSDKVDLKSCYCSIHNECWSVSLRQVRTTRTLSCRTKFTSATDRLKQ